MFLITTLCFACQSVAAANVTTYSCGCFFNGHKSLIEIRSDCPETVLGSLPLLGQGRRRSGIVLVRCQLENELFLQELIHLENNKHHAITSQNMDSLSMLEVSSHRTQLS